MNSHRLSCICTALILAACTGPGSVNGTVAHHGLKVGSSAFGTTQVAGSAGDSSRPALSFGLIVLSSGKNACSTHVRPGETALLISLGMPGDQPRIGVFDAVDPTSAAADPNAIASLLLGASFSTMVAENDQCINQINDGDGNAVAGRVVVDNITTSRGGTADGSFSLSMGSHRESIQGTYSATYCAEISQVLATHFADPNAWLSFPTLPCQ